MLDMLKFLRTEYKPAPGEFLPINMTVLVDKLKIRERGAERGAKGLPASNSKQMDEVEQEIVEAIRAQVLDDERRTHEQLSLYAQRLKAADPAGTAAEMLVTARQSVAGFNAEAIAGRGELEQARRSVVEWRAALAAFKAKNKLDRPADPPKGHYMMAAVLAVLFLIETAPNAAFLSAGEELGFIGAYAIAIVFSLLNLASGFLAGLYGWSNARHQQPARKIGGVLLAVCLIALVAFINLLIAHYRVAVGSGLESAEAAQRAIETIWGPIEDATSLAMVGVGVLFSLIAMLEGYMWRDSYPGYAAVSYHLDKAEQYWNALVEERLSLLQDVEQRHISEIRGARARLRDRQMQIPEIVENRARLAKNFVLHVAHLEGVVRYALTAYRDANRTARKTDDVAPARFDEPWHLEGMPTAETPTAQVTVAASEWEKADAALMQSVEQLQRAYEEAVGWIKTLGHSPDAETADMSAVKAREAGAAGSWAADQGIADGRPA